MEKFVRMYHYTTDVGFKAIRSQVEWKFKAAKPPGPHPYGAYFTPLRPDAADLCTKLLIPKVKTEYVFEFSGDEGLEKLDNGKGRGRHISYSPVDYLVSDARQKYSGKSKDYKRTDKEPT